MNTNEEGNYVNIFIDDDGPGIPEKERQNIFKPFYRTDNARNLDNGGVGLGLSISQDVVYSHGGNISMDKSSIGGLRVIIKLPI
jgi:two-component system osmolarity sensor histidine kinase EnvZ